MKIHSSFNQVNHHYHVFKFCFMVTFLCIYVDVRIS